MLTDPVAGDPLHAGPVFAAPFHVPGEPAEAPYSYGRSHNPTWTALERALGVIESGEGYRARALVFGSGMAAVAAVFGAALRPGDAVVLPSNAYFTARVLAEVYFGAMGVEVRLAEAGAPQGDLLRGARLLWLETPGNPGMQICDIRALSARAHAEGCLVACDNTTATPLGQRVLELGADYAVVSDSKAMTGHSDLLLGHVAVRVPGEPGGAAGRRADGGLAGGEVAGDAAAATGAKLRQRDADRRVSPWARGGVAGDVSGAAGASGARDRGAADAELRAGAELCAAGPGGGGEISGCGGAGEQRDQLRRGDDDRGTPGAVGSRCDRGGIYPAERGM